MAFVRTTKTWPATNGNVPPWQHFAIGANICIRFAIYVLAKEKKWFGNRGLTYANLPGGLLRPKRSAFPPPHHGAFDSKTESLQMPICGCGFCNA
jgi:hypothetical protein